MLLTNTSLFIITLVAAADFNGISIICNVTAVDVPSNIFKVAFSFLPAGPSLSSLLNTSSPSNQSSSASTINAQKKYTFLTRPVSILIGSTSLSFKQGQPMPNAALSVSFESGNVNRYPFDIFSTSFLVSASLTNDSTQSIPLTFSLTGLAQAFHITPELEDPSSPFYIQVQLTASRSFTTKFFSLFIVSSMWILSFTVFTLATTLWLRDRQVEPPTIGFCAGFLFALPAIRNSQPGAPPIGCTVDVAGFFWNMSLVMVSTVLLMVNYIKKKQRETKVVDGAAKSL